MRVDIVVFDGVDDLDVVGPFEVLGMARRAGLGVTVRLVSLEGPRTVTSQGGLPLPAALAAAARPGLVFASVCTGALLLAAAGLLTGRASTTHHRAVAELVAAGGSHVDARVVDDGDLVTAGGITCGLDLALWLVERHLGADAAGMLQRVLEYERREPLWRTGHEVSLHGADR
ncbi:DJ-1/PfpI family protein [Nonomuraea lactucae]|uniref:DJ-1/PfpI family protein n=1 Tax=Nonomuraea lactucae TaxID=2249762 RepID=UPI000DE2960D|nr:DJ-1/PfpI family protein [Nonomuraea lactucae]